MPTANTSHGAKETPIPRVLHVVGAMNVGGAETMLMNLYRRADRSRIQFDFLVYEDETAAYDDEIVRLGGRIFRLPGPRARGVRRATADVRSVLREHGPFQAVHAHILHANALAVRAAAAERVDIRIAHSHNTGDVTGGLLRALYMRWARRSIRNHATRMVACGAEAGAYLFGDDAEWMLLRNGVDLDCFRPPDEQVRREARQDLDVAEDCLLLGSVARLEPVKNHEFILRVASGLASKGTPFRVVLAGEGSRRAELERLAGELGVAAQVDFLGLWREVPQLLAALDGLLMPSHYEGIPVALVEAQATGLPCLVSEAVSREADLGLGLVDFLPTDTPEPWLAAIVALRERRSSRTHSDFERLLAAGANIDEGVALLYRLYELERRP